MTVKNNLPGGKRLKITVVTAILVFLLSSFFAACLALMIIGIEIMATTNQEESSHEIHHIKHLILCRPFITAGNKNI
jgi:hypothetical protein